MTTYLIYGVHKKFLLVQDEEWTEKLEDDLFTGNCPDVGEIRMLRGCNPYEADTICIGQILARIDGPVDALQEIDMDHLRDGDILALVRMYAQDYRYEFSPIGVYLFSVFD